MRRERFSLERRWNASSGVGAGFLVRLVVLACVAISGAVWALVHYYTHPRVPMTVAVPPPPETAWDAGPGLLLAPEIEVERP
jgi:hypothetical protein